MENSNFTDTKTPLDTPLIFAEKDSWEYISSLLSKLNVSHKLTLEKKTADLTISDSNNFLNLEIKGFEEKVRIKKIHASTYLCRIILHIKSHKTTQSKNKKFIEDKQSFFKSLSPHHTLMEQLDEVLEKSNNTVEFGQNLLKSTSFKNFKRIYIFAHQKGSSQVTAYSIQDDFSELNLTIENFTELFHAIKKSKNKTFGQEGLKASAFNILGTCIAHEFNLRNHNLILVFSNDDFLPQKQEDINFLSSHRENLQFYFEIILSKTLSFKNKKYFEDIFSFLKIQPQFNSNQIQKRIMQFKETNSNIADVHQQERISLLGELLNTLKHELSNPLFGLQLTSELLINEELDPDQMEFINSIHTNIIRSQKIISNFSGLYSKSEESEKVNIEKVISEVLILTKSESRQIKKEVINNIESNSEFELNQTWLAQILFNLIINSVQAFKEEKIDSPTISITLDKDNESITISVHDNGPGITSDISQEIFSPFCTTKDNGTGLGLAISSRLAEKMGGSLKHQMTESGTCFKLELPI